MKDYKITGYKSLVYRYLSMLVETGYVEVSGKTNNAVYRVVEGMLIQN